MGGPKSNGKCPYRKGRGHRDTEEKMCVDRGRDWRDVATAGVPGAPSGAHTLIVDLRLQNWEGIEFFPKPPGVW